MPMRAIHISMFLLVGLAALFLFTSELRTRSKTSLIQSRLQPRPTLEISSAESNNSDPNGANLKTEAGSKISNSEDTNREMHDWNKLDKAALAASALLAEKSRREYAMALKYLESISPINQSQRDAAIAHSSLAFNAALKKSLCLLLSLAIKPHPTSISNGMRECFAIFGSTSNTILHRLDPDIGFFIVRRSARTGLLRCIALWISCFEKVVLVDYRGSIEI